MTASHLPLCYWVSMSEPPLLTESSGQNGGILSEDYSITHNVGKLHLTSYWYSSDLYSMAHGAMEDEMH